MRFGFPSLTAVALIFCVISERQVDRDLGGEGQVRDEGVVLRPVEEAEEVGQERDGKSSKAKRKAARLDS